MIVRVRSRDVARVERLRRGLVLGDVPRRTHQHHRVVAGQRHPVQQPRHRRQRSHRRPSTDPDPIRPLRAGPTPPSRSWASRSSTSSARSGRRRPARPVHGGPILDAALRIGDSAMHRASHEGVTVIPSSPVRSTAFELARPPPYQSRRAVAGDHGAARVARRW